MGMIRGMAVLALMGCLALPTQGQMICREVTVVESPDTGDHMNPVFTAMGLVLSGMGLYFCGEKIWKK